MLYLHQAMYTCYDAKMIEISSTVHHMNIWCNFMSHCGVGMELWAILHDAWKNLPTNFLIKLLKCTDADLNAVCSHQKLTL